MTRPVVLPVAVLAAVALIASACGGRPEVFLDRPAVDESPAAFELPDPIPAAPAWVARLDTPAGPKRLEKLSRIKGVAVIAPVRLKTLRVTGPKRRARLRVATADPLLFRSVAPPSTRDAEFVWTSLMSERAVITTDAARKLGVRSAQELQVGGIAFHVGAFADNGVPNIADVLVAPRVVRSLPLGKPRLLVVGAKTGTTVEALGRDLREQLPGARLRRIRPETQPAQPAAPQNVGTASGATIGTMTFRILQNGFISPDPAWVASNITSASVPILGTVTCHRIMVPQLARALGEIEREGLAGQIRPGDYAGCYVPRFIDRDPRRGLSMHAFGLAVDLNVSTNQLGTRGDIDPRIVAIFQKWGFAWGGHWSRPDPMHFELARIIRT